MFNIDVELIYDGEVNYGKTYTYLKNQTKNIEKILSKCPRNFAYKTEVNEICSNISLVSSTINQIDSNLNKLITDLGNKGLLDQTYYDLYNPSNMLADGTLDYINAMGTVNEMNDLNDFSYNILLANEGNLKDSEQLSLNIMRSQKNIENMSKKLSELNEDSSEYKNLLEQYSLENSNYNELMITYYESKDTLSGEELESYQYFKDMKELNVLEAELLELEKNAVSKPASLSSNSRMSVEEGKLYAEQTKKYNEFENNKKNLEKRIKELQKSTGTYQPSTWDNIVQGVKDVYNAEVQCKAEWREGYVSLFTGGGFGELKDAFDKTLSTRVVQATSIANGILKVGEWIGDAKTFIDGTTLSGVTWLLHDTWSKNDLADDVMDKTLDEIRKDKVGNANKWFYEETGAGKWINAESLLKYNSQGAKLLQDSAEMATKIALATAATVATGGTAVPIILGAMYGIGQYTESYAQSVNRENGENYNYVRAFGKAAVGGVVGASEFYGYGQIGSGIFNGFKALNGVRATVNSTGSNISASFGKNFVKNFLEVDTFLDSGAVIMDHGVNILLGDETLDQALTYGGLELGFALGLNAFGASIGSAFETKNAKALFGSNEVDTPKPKKLYKDRITAFSNKVKVVSNNFSTTMKNINNNLDNFAINSSINNILTNPNFINSVSTDSVRTAAFSFLGLATNVFYNKRAVKNVLDNIEFTDKILKEGLVHFAPSEDVADAIISSKFLKAKNLKFDLLHPINTAKNNIKYFANQGKKTFMFAGVPSYEEMLLNVDIKPTMVGVRIKPETSQLTNLGYRYLDDNALIHNGDFDFSSSKDVEKVYLGLKYDEFNNKLFYTEITKAEFDNYKLDIDSKTFKKLTDSMAKTKTQIDLMYGDLKFQLDNFNVKLNSDVSFKDLFDYFKDLNYDSKIMIVNNFKNLDDANLQKIKDSKVLTHEFISKIFSQTRETADIVSLTDEIIDKIQKNLLIEDPNAFYGYSPSREQFKSNVWYDMKEMSFNDEFALKRNRVAREFYIERSKVMKEEMINQFGVSLDDINKYSALELDKIIKSKTNNTQNLETLAKYCVDARNQDKVVARIFNTAEELSYIETRNIDKYGTPIGMNLNQIIADKKVKGKYKGIESLKDIINSSFRKDLVLNTILGIAYE